MSKSIDEVEFTIFDTETTGLDPQGGDRIVEIAAIRFRGKEKISSFSTLVNPKRPVSQAAFAVNHITEEMLKDAPVMEQVAGDFLDFVKDTCLCSYNAPFDLGFLNNELKLTGFTPLEGLIVVDVLKMARRLLPGLQRYALWFVAEALGIKAQQAHRASSDVELTLQVFNRLKAALKKKGIEDFHNFSGLFSISRQFLEDINNQKIAKIQEAMDLGLKLKIRYLAAVNAEVTEREVIPKEIIKENNRTYLVGYCCLREDERSFRIDGILQLENV